MKTYCQKEHGKQKRVAEEEEEEKLKRDLEKAGTNSQEWKTTAEDRGKWRTLTTKAEEAIKQLGPHPAREQREEE